MNTQETEINASDAWISLVVGVVLAGGLSRRMGGNDKSLMQLGGKPMIAYAVKRLTPQTGTVIINANRDSMAYADYSCTVVPDTIEGFAGPLAGVLAGMEWARMNAPNAKWVATAAADTPFFPTNLVASCVTEVGYKQDVIALAKSGDKLHPVFGLWPISLADDLREWLSDEANRKVLAWVDRHNMTAITFPEFELANEMIDPFFNVNNPEDLETAKIIHAQVSS